jgi:hypothetical protein
LKHKSEKHARINYLYTVVSEMHEMQEMIPPRTLLDNFINYPLGAGGRTSPASHASPGTNIPAHTTASRSICSAQTEVCVRRSRGP